MKWPWIRRKTHLRELAAVRTATRCQREKDERQRGEDAEAFQRVYTVLHDLERALFALDWPRLSAIETDGGFTDAAIRQLQREESFAASWGRTPVAYERLCLLGIEVRPDEKRPGCVTLVPETPK